MGSTKITISFLILTLFALEVSAQDRYAVFFKFKPQDSFSLDKPIEYLTQTALDRRSKEGISADSLDLPISKQYLEAVGKISNYILYSSKWLNATLVVADEQLVKECSSLPFVDRVELVGIGYTPSPNTRVNPKVFNSFTLQTCAFCGESPRTLKIDENTYDFQNTLLGIDQMHADGFTGKGITIAVFDAGFPEADKISALSHLQTGNKIIGIKDLVRPWNSDVYSENQHGTNVLSLIASNEPGFMVAGAYDANYILVRTEEVATEYRIEEYNWTRAAEYADSLGTDIISSSLGYYHFDDPKMNYSPADLDGKTTTISKAASIAASKGILVVNSAGNTGPGDTSIASPADAKGILAIAAVGKNLEVSTFSSRGPTAQGRIKPDLAALGDSTALIRSNGKVGFANGTSFSAPQIAGLAAGLWEARPDWTKDELIERLLKSASQFDTPDNLLGYGIPNFRKALYGEILGVEEKEIISWKVFPNPLLYDELNIYFGTELNSEFSLFDLNGRVLENLQLTRPNRKEPYRIQLVGLKPGLYLIQIQQGSLIKQSKLIKK
jgi:subtilisin family serine protease